jgi:hypothetical protein
MPWSVARPVALSAMPAIPTVYRLKPQNLPLTTTRQVSNK